jgi:hypothetical protein
MSAPIPPDVDDAPTGGMAGDWLLWIVIAVTVPVQFKTLTAAITGQSDPAPLLYGLGALGLVLVVWGGLRRYRRNALAARYEFALVADGVWNPTSYAQARGVSQAFSIRTFTLVVTATQVEVWQGFLRPRLVVAWPAEEILSLSAGRSFERVPASTLRVTTAAGTTSLLLLTTRWVRITRMPGQAAVTFATNARRLLAPLRPHTTAAH